MNLLFIALLLGRHWRHDISWYRLSHNPRGMPLMPALSSPQSKFAVFASVDDEEMLVTSIRDDISLVIDRLIDSKRESADNGDLDPTVLLENAHFLTKGRLYEEIMSERMEAASNRQEVQELESIDAFLKGFISSERKARSRLKVNYILAGAGSNRLDESVALLSESDEIDEELMFYLDSLIKKEILRAAGPSAILDDDRQSNSNGGSSSANTMDLEEDIGASSEIERHIGETNKDALSILRMIQRRLKAELRMKDRAEVQLLGRLLNEPIPEKRVSLLKRSVDKVEFLETFRDFLNDGVSHLTAEQSNLRTSSDNQDDNDDVDMGGMGATSSNTGSGLPVATVEVMKDILYDVESIIQKLATGLRDSDTYSTETEDYADK